MIKKIIGITTFLFFCFLPVISASPQKDITLTLVEKQIQELSPSGCKIVYYVNLSNASSKDYYLSGYKYQFMIGQDEYISLSQPMEPELRIPAVKDTMIAIPVKITYDLLFRSVPEAADKDMIQCFLAGELGFSDGRRERGRIPVSFKGEFPVFKAPSVHLNAIILKTLTVGGADLDFAATFSNPNGFELMVDAITYSVKIGGHEINHGRIKGDKNIPKKGEKKFQLPQLINFYEVGKDVYALLQQESASCSFNGVIKLRTIWGGLEVPFELTEKAPIRKE